MKLAKPATEAAGHGHLANGGVDSVYEGDWPPRRIVISEFRSVTAFENFDIGLPTLATGRSGTRAVRRAYCRWKACPGPVGRPGRARERLASATSCSRCLRDFDALLAEIGAKHLLDWRLTSTRAQRSTVYRRAIELGVFCTGVRIALAQTMSTRCGAGDCNPGEKEKSNAPHADGALPEDTVHDDPGQEELAMSNGTVRLHRVLRSKPEKIYRAFLDSGAIAKWLPPFGFTCSVQQLDPRVGGGFRMSFHNFSTGDRHSFGGVYLEMVPGELIRYTDRFDDPQLPGEMRVTISLKPVSCGTEVTITQEGIPEAIPLEMCYLGWQESLVQLANLVEPERPG